MQNYQLNIFTFWPHCAACGIRYYFSFLIRDRTQALCSRNTESEPLDCQGSPNLFTFYSSIQISYFSSISVVYLSSRKVTFFLSFVICWHSSCSQYPLMLLFYFWKSISDDPHFITDFINLSLLSPFYFFCLL